jgi:hypothetical protein
MVKRYLAVVGVILVVVLGLGFWLKPSLDILHESVDEPLRIYAREHPELGAVKPTDVETHDWIVAVSYSARLGNVTVSCWGAFKVTVCTGP